MPVGKPEGDSADQKSSNSGVPRTRTPLGRRRDPRPGGGAAGGRAGWPGGRVQAAAELVELVEVVELPTVWPAGCRAGAGGRGLAHLVRCGAGGQLLQAWRMRSRWCAWHSVRVRCRCCAWCAGQLRRARSGWCGCRLSRCRRASSGAAGAGCRPAGGTGGAPQCRRDGSIEQAYFPRAFDRNADGKVR